MTTISHEPPELAEMANRLRAHRLPPPAERRAIRRAARATLEDVANALGVSQLSVSNWERGLHEPRPCYIAPYRRVLELLAELAQEDRTGQVQK